MPKRAVIFGNAGQLGVELTSELEKRGYEVTGTDRSQLDITNRQLVEQHLAEVDPEVVFNAAAHNQVDVAEEDPEAAFQVNALAVRNVALGCRQVNARLVHFSTDYVFDGRAGRPYTEQDATHPLGAYAVSKLAGELYAQAYLDAPLILRTSGVFGPGGLHTARGNFIESMLRLAATGKPIRVVEDHFASPAYAPALAARSVDLYERGATGVFHVGGGTPVSWFRYAQLLFEVAGLTPELKPTNEREYRTAARRPRFSALANARMEALGIEPMPPFEWCIRDYFARREKYRRQSA
ncbi:MAG: dTDP-4-dehydrorhamnose reductase [Acidobacteriota bacterium]